MRFFEERLDSALDEEVVLEEPINEIGNLIRKLLPVDVGARGISRKTKADQIKPIVSFDLDGEVVQGTVQSATRDEVVVDYDGNLIKIDPEDVIGSSEPEERISEPEAVEKAKPAETAPTQHIASYAVARGKGFIRVGIDGDKALTKGRLHIFKKGERYYGFLVLPGPGGKRQKASESFSYRMSVIMELSIYEAVSDVVLKFDSDDLGELFDLSNYTQKSGLSPDKFSEYEGDIKLLDVDAAEKADVGKLPWGKQQREQFRQEDPVEVDFRLIQKLVNDYTKMAEMPRLHPYDKTLYKRMADFIGNMRSKDQLKNLLDNMKKGSRKKIKRGDDESLRRAQLLGSLIDNVSDALELGL